MKHRVREAIFNLVGPAAQGAVALDLFAGTGALGIEALSRGATHATFVERHVPTASLIRENLNRVGALETSRVHTTSAFLWAKRDLPAASADAAWAPSGAPWIAFVCPPYALFVDRAEQMLALIATLLAHAPGGSLLVVEADGRFDFGRLPGGVRPDRHSPGWDVRRYPPAVVGIWRVATD